MSPNDYSHSFLRPSTVADYERFYEKGTPDEAMWNVEQEFLATFYARNKHLWPHCSYLDFACGTGRVIAVMERLVEKSRGIDISPQMLEAARTKISASELVCADIAAEDRVEGKYDLITAFRFFLNAEPGLRYETMERLAHRLKDEDSRLVFNNHGNPWSYKAIVWPFHRTRHLLFGRKTAGNYLTHHEIAELVSKSKLSIVERFGCGVISPKLFKIAPLFARATERRLAGSRFARWAGVNQLYVVKRSSNVDFGSDEQIH